MFDSYCLNLNPLEAPWEDPIQRIQQLITAVERVNNLPEGILVQKQGNGAPVKRYGEVYLPQLRTAIVHHIKARGGIQDKYISKALKIDKSTLTYHKKTARDLVDTGNEPFKFYLQMVQGIAV